MAVKGSRIPIEDRLNKYKRVDSETGCWGWCGARVLGYGHIGILSSDGVMKHCKVHRVSYELYVGPIPEGLVLDHLCRNRACFNPEHLEPVTVAENIRRGISPSAVNRVKTHCAHGHEYTPDNTYVPPNGQRVCRTCRAEAAKRAQARRRTGKRTAPRPIAQRIAEFAEPSGEHLLWRGHVARTGAVINGERINGRNAGKILVKRFLYESAYGEVGATHAVERTCVEPLCVSPEHHRARSRSEIITEAKRRA